MRRGLGFLGLVLTLVIIGIVGVIAYNVGWSDGLAQHLPQGTSTAPAVYPYPYYGYGPHFFGFGWIFGLLFFLFFLFVIFRIARFAMWGGRGWGHYGGPGGWHQYREERMREWHDRVHSGQSGSQTPPPPPPPATTA